MSAWKWRQLYAKAASLQLSSLLHDSVTACSSQFFMQLPEDLATTWQQTAEAAEAKHRQASSEVAELLGLLGTMQMRPILLEPWASVGLYPYPEHCVSARVAIYFPYETQGHKADEWAKANGSRHDESHKHILTYQWKSLDVEHRHRMFLLSNKLNNMTLQGIIEHEWLEGGTSHVVLDGQRIEIVAPTLAMLTALLSIVKTTINEGLHLWQILDLGIMLRQQGQLVDFVKLQGWIERLHFGRMAQHIGLILTGLLGFSVDETPFMRPEEADADSLAGELLGENARPTKYIRYYPSESIASVMSSITHSLGNVQE